MAENTPPPEPAPPPPPPAPAPAAPARRATGSWRTGTARGQRTESIITPVQWRFAGLMAVLLMLLGFGIGWVLLPQRKPAPAFHSLVITEYKSPYLRPIPFAGQDENLLCACFENSRRYFERQESDSFRRALDQLRTVGDEVAVFHVHSLAACVRDHVYLLPADARPDDPGSTGVSLVDVLAAVDGCPARRCLVLLDLSAVPTDPDAAIAPSDLAAAVKATVLRQEGRRAFVLCSCSDHQQPLPAEAWGQSAFAHFVAEGLCGAADGFGPTGEKDGWIRVHELADYVAQKVDDWAWYTRRASQTPELLAPGDDAYNFAVAYDDRAQPPATPVVAYPDWLGKQWEFRDRWKAERRFRVAPRPYRTLEAALLRAEQRCLGGRDPAVVETELTALLTKPVAAADKAKADADPVTPRSVAALEFSAEDRKAVTDAATAVGEVLDGLQGKPPADRDAELKKLLAQWAGKLTPQQRAAAVFEAAVAVAPGKDRLRMLVALLPREPSGRFAETVLLERVANISDNHVSPDLWRPLPFGRLIKIVAVEERAVAGDPAAVAPFQDAIEKLSDRRRQAEIELVRKHWDAATRELQEVDEAFQVIAGRVQVMGDAARTLEEVAVFLPGCAPYVAASGDARLNSAWEAAVRSAGTLYNMQDHPVPPAREAVAQELNVLRDALDVLHEPFAAGRLRDLAGRVDAEKAGPQDVVEIGRLLDSPLPDAASRVQLAGLTGKVTERLYRTEDGKAESRKVAAARAADPPNVVASLRRLAGVGRAELRSADVLREAASNPRRAARLSIALDPFDDADGGAAPAATATATAEQARSGKAWLAQRYRAEAEAYADETRTGKKNVYVHDVSAEYFGRTAERYR